MRECAWHGGGTAIARRATPTFALSHFALTHFPKMQDLNSKHDADAALAEPSAILFKHSTRCPISAGARQEMEAFLAEGPGMPVYAVDVNARTEVSDYLAERTGVEHQSPQVIVLRGGRPAWHASRLEVTAAALREQVGSAAGGG